MSKDNRVTACIGSGPQQVIHIILGILHSRIVFCWFASVYAAIATLAARILGKKSVIVVGGVDMAKEKEFGYGLWLSPWKSVLVRSAIKNADRVLVVDQSLKTEVLARVHYDGNNLEVVPTGFDHEFWQPAGTKERLVLTVAAIQNEGRLKIKGIDIVFDVARRLPRTQFALIGFDTIRFKDFTPPANLIVHPVLEQAQLLQYYQRAKIFCQPSRREGLSNTLCEAMLCGCIPVVSDVGGSAQTVGDNGVVVPPADVGALAAGIERALAMPDSLGRKARERIVSRFPKEQREQRLQELIREINP